MNGRLQGFRSAFDRGVYIRTFLADERLVPRRGERFWPEPDQVEECRRRGEETLEFLRRTSVHVVGDVDHLRVPDVLEPRRSTLSVTDEEVADVAVDLVARMLGDVRGLRRARRTDRAADGRTRRGSTGRGPTRDRRTRDWPALLRRVTRRSR